MNILAIAPYRMYRSYTSSFIHNQNKAFVQLGHRVRAVVPLAAGKCSNSGKRAGPCLEWVEQDGVEICFVRHLSLGSLGANRFNHVSARLAVQMFAPKILRDFCPDVIHASALNHSGPIGLYLKQYCGAPLVLTTLGGDTTVVMEQGGGPRLRGLCDQADMLIANSFSLLENYEKLGTKTPRQCIISGFETQYVQKLPKRPHSVIQVGNLVASKHNDFTIHAVARLKESYPDITLTVVGDGPERKRLENLCSELGLDDTVRFLGRLPNPDTLEEMARAQLFVMPSYPEGLGIVYLEAMASGCVAIGTEGEGISGVITSGENGFLVPRDNVDAIVEVVGSCFRDEALLKRVAEAGQSHVQSLTWPNNAARYVELFQTLTRQGS